MQETNAVPIIKYTDFQTLNHQIVAGFYDGLTWRYGIKFWAFWALRAGSVDLFLSRVWRRALRSYVVFRSLGIFFECDTGNGRAGLLIKKRAHGVSVLFVLNVASRDPAALRATL